METISICMHVNGVEKKRNRVPASHEANSLKKQSNDLFGPLLPLDDSFHPIYYLFSLSHLLWPWTMWRLDVDDEV